MKITFTLGPTLDRDQSYNLASLTTAEKLIITDVFIIYD